MITYDLDELASLPIGADDSPTRSYIHLIRFGV